MNLIDSTYFTGKISLPGLETLAGSESTGMDKLVNDLTVNGLNLTRLISECQAEYLQKMLGKKLAAHFLENISSEAPAGIWIDLMERLVNSRIRKSPIANYVYFFILRYGMTRTSMSGEKKEKSDHAHNASIMPKSVFAWNEMIEMNRAFLTWIEDGKDAYAPYMDEEWIPDRDILEPVNSFNL